VYRRGALFNFRPEVLIAVGPVKERYIEMGSTADRVRESFLDLMREHEGRDDFPLIEALQEHVFPILDAAEIIAANWSKSCFHYANGCDCSNCVAARRILAAGEGE
jgi:hypothetical protein